MLNQWSTPNGDCWFCVSNSQSASRLGVARACGRKLCSNNLAMWQCSLRNRLVTWYGSGATRIPAEDWRWKRDKSRTKHEKHITWLLGTLETFILEFWTFCALILRRVVTFAIRVWYGRDLGIDLDFIPAYLAIESSKANPNSSWHGHQIGSLIVVDHFRVLHETFRRGGMAWIVCRRVFSISRRRSKQLPMESRAIVCLESI